MSKSQRSSILFLLLAIMVVGITGYLFRHTPTIIGLGGTKVAEQITAPLDAIHRLDARKSTSQEPIDKYAEISGTNAENDAYQLPPSRKSYEEIETLISHEDRAEGSGLISRVRIVSTDFKYPLLRVEEVFADSQEPAREPVRIKSSVMVADHILLRCEKSQQRRIAGELRELGYSLRVSPSQFEPFLRVLVPTDKIDAFHNAMDTIVQNINGVTAEPDYLVTIHRTPDDPLFQNQWSLANGGQTGGTVGADVGAREGWDETTGSGDVIVAVLDTGIDFSHPDLTGNIFMNPLEIGDGEDTDGNGFIDDLMGWDFYGGNNDPSDGNYHGTHVSGTIGARGNNGIGISGVNWDVKILPVRVFSDLGTGTLSDAILGIRYAADSGARVINASWGFREDSALLYDAIDYAASKECLVVASAGNDGSSNDLYPVYPASIPLDNVISVAATDHDDNLAGFSNYGNSVDIAAPGIGILSTTPMIRTLWMLGASIFEEYGHSSGTSMSAPYVSGAIALLISKNPNITALQAKERLLERAKFIPSLSGLLRDSSRLELGDLFEDELETSPAALAIHSSRWKGKSGSVLSSGIVRPGDEVDLEINLVNEGTAAAESGSLQLEILSGRASLVGASSVALGTVAGKEFRNVSPLPYVRVLPDSPDNLSVRVRMTLTWDGGGTVSTILEIPVVDLNVVQAVQRLPFQVSEVLAAPTPNLVYMLSPSDWRVLAFDTDLAQFTLYQQLGVKPSDPNNRVFGGMTVNQAGNRLYVTLPRQKQIHVLSLPSLTPLVVLNTSFEAKSLALDSQGRIFASTYGASGALRQISAVDGSVIGIHSGDIPTGNNLLGYGAVLKTNAAGTRLYASDPRGLGPNVFQTWDVGSPTVKYLGGSPILNGYITDFAIDAENDRIFSTHDAINALQVSHFNPQRVQDYLPFRTSGGTELSIANGGAAVSFAVGKNYVLAASSYTDSAYIHRFKRDTGESLGSYVTMSEYDREEILPRSMCVTQNDRVVFIATVPSRNAFGAEYKYDHYINLIGATTIDPSVPPPTAPPAQVDLVSVSLQDFGGNADGIPNPGEAVSLRFSFKNLGQSPSPGYTLHLESTNPAAVVSGSPTAIPSISGGNSYLTSAVPVDLAESLADGSEVAFTITLSGLDGVSLTFNHTITIISTSVPTAPPKPAFTETRLTAIVPSPTINEVYLADASGGRVIAVDTTLGAIRKVARIPDERRSNMAIPIQDLRIAVSPDGTRLALFSRYETDVHVFRLPDLTWLDSFTMPQLNHELAFDSQNHIHAAGRRDSHVNSTQILKVDSETGVVLTSYGSHAGSAGLLKVSPDGSLLAMSHFVSSFSPIEGGTVVYDIGDSGPPELIASLPTPTSFLVFRGSSIWMPSGSSIREYNLTSGTYGRSTAGTDFFTSLNLTPNDRFVCSNQTVICEYQSLVPKETVVSVLYNQTHAGSIRSNGIAITPDGRISYLTEGAVHFPGGVTTSRRWHAFGIIGQEVSLEEPSALPVKLLRTDILDSAPGNANGYAEPGEDIQIIPFLRNTDFIRISGLSVVLASVNPNVTVLGQNSRNFPAVSALTNFNMDTPFSVRLSPQIADGEPLGLSLLLSYGSVIDSIPLNLFALKPELAYAETDFELGETLTHPFLNVVYLVDKTNSRLLALNTDTGNIVEYAKLAGSPGGGEIAVSTDGERVAVALADANMIQILDAGSLSAVDLIHLDFKPERISFATDNAIYANSSIDRKIMRIDPDKGEARPLTTVEISKIYQPSAEFREPFSFTTTFDGSFGGSEAGRKFHVPLHMLEPLFGRDTAFDPDGERIFSAGNARGGYAVKSLTTGDTSVRYDPVEYSDGAAIALHPSVPFLYVAEDKNWNPFVTRIDRKTGKILGKFAGKRTSAGPGWVKWRSLEVTRNGKVFFATGDYHPASGSRIFGLHLIGGSGLSLALPEGKVPLDAGADLTVKVTNPAVFSTKLAAVETSETLWSKLAGPGSVTFSKNGDRLVASFSQPGLYRLESKSAIPGVPAADMVLVNVQPANARIYAEVIRPVATSIPLRPAILRVFREGDLDTALEISIQTGGTAVSGLHYVPLAEKYRFEAGETELDIEVVPTRYGGIQDAEISLTILPADGYTGDSRVFVFPLFEGDFDTLTKDLLDANPGTSIVEDGDNNGNGIPNLLEYAMGFDPIDSGSSPLLYATHNPTMRLHFNSRERLTDASLEVQFSSDMKNWSTHWQGKPAVREVFRFGGGSVPQRISVELSPEAAAEPNGFLRLRAIRIAR